MTTSQNQPAVVATGLRKSFGDQVVLDGIDLDVAEGTIFALLGPNGAGKTTASAAAWSPARACRALAEALSWTAAASTSSSRRESR